MFGKPDVSRLKGSGDIAGLIKALGYRKDESVPAKAAGALGDVGDQRAIEPLAAWIRQASGHDDRVVAIGSIGKIGGPAAADALLDLLTRPPERAESTDGHSVSVQPEVARQLAEVGDERAIRPLEAWIRQDMPYPYVGAIDSIGKIGGQVAADVLLKLFSDVTADARAARVRASVASALGEAGDQRAIDPLKAWLYQTDKSDDRKAAIDSIGKIGGSAVTNFLLELVPDTRFRDSATAALGYTGDPRALARLLQLLTDATDGLSAVATGLGRFGDSRGVVPLCTLLSEKLNEVFPATFS